MGILIAGGVFLFFLLPSVLAGGCGTRIIGSLPNLFHGVSGTLYLIDDDQFCIDGFTYDGLGPDAFLYFYYPGDPISDTGGGVIVNLTNDRAAFQLNRAYNGEVLQIMLPPNFRACDFEGFGIWCRYANQLFTNITWNNTVLFENTPCDPSPGRGYVGPLESTMHNVGGTLFMRDNKTMVIKDFTYDGQAPDTFVYWYPPNVEVTHGGGNIIPLPAPVGDPSQEGRFVIGRAYNIPSENPNFVITIPDNMDVYTCDMAVFTLWCRQASVFFTTVSVDSELFTNNPLEAAYEPNRILCNRPTTSPGAYVGELPTTNPREISGTVFVQDRYTLFIQLFSFRANRPNVYLYYYPPGVTPNDNGMGGVRINVSATDGPFPMGRSSSYYNSDLTVDLRLAMGGPVSACDIGNFAIIDLQVNEQLTYIEIPQNIFSTQDEAGKITCTPSSATDATDATDVTDGAIPAHSNLGLFGALVTMLLAYVLY